MVIKVAMLVLFFGVMIGVGLYCRKTATNVNGFVLGGRNVGPWLTAFAYGTSYFSAVIFIGYAGQFGWKFGIASTWIGIGNAVIGSLLAWVILGKRTRSMTHNLNSKTMPEFFGQRFDSKFLKILASIIVFIFLIPYTASLYGGSKSGGFKALEERYKQANVYGDSGVARMLGSGTLARGSILYGQELWGDEKNRRFMDDAWAETGLKGIQTFTDGFTDAVTQFANGAKTFKDALKDFATSSLQTIGNWIIQMSVKAMAMLAIKSMFPEFFGAQVYSEPIGPTQVPNAGGFYGRAAAGGAVSGGIPNRDSVNTKLMPGEYVLKKSAVDYLGKNFLNALNANTAQTMSAVSGDIIAGDNSPASVVNVWVVSDEEEAGMGPNDVIATITKDIRNGGQTRQLIKSIVAGRK